MDSSIATSTMSSKAMGLSTYYSITKSVLMSCGPAQIIGIPCACVSAFKSLQAKNKYDMLLQQHPEYIGQTSNDDIDLENAFDNLHESLAHKGEKSTIRREIESAKYEAEHNESNSKGYLISMIPLIGTFVAKVNGFKD
jgi:hypothetical protein